MSLEAVAPKLTKLLPLLGTNHDGEALAAVRAIERTLKSAGLDFHDLASSLEAIAALSRDPQTWEEVAIWCRDNDHGRLAPREREFITSVAAHLVCGRQPTEAQEAWLRAIYVRMRREATH